MLISYRRALYNFKTIEWKLWEEIHFTVTIYYAIISKIRHKFKNNPIVKKSTSPVVNLLDKTCAKFVSNPPKTVGGDRF